MIDWWNSLSLALQIFYGIGILSLLLTVGQLLLSLLGLGGDLVDLDVPEGDGSSGAGLFSFQTLSAFFLGFGWVGASVLSAGCGLLLTLVVASVLGFAFMVAMYALIRVLMKLQSSGNLDYRTAIGREATVYVTLPGDDADGGGQIQLMLQGRLRVAHARKASPGPARPGDKVRITGMYADTTYTVEAARPAAAAE